MYNILLIFFIYSTINILFAQTDSDTGFEGSEYFNVGMFSVVGHMANVPQPGSKEFRDDLQKMYSGTNNGYRAINTVHTYSHFIGDTTFWTTYLNDINSISDSLKSLGDCQFYYVDTNGDSLISQDEINAFSTLIENFLTSPNSDHIAGWYIADEPSAHEYEPSEVAKIYNAIKQRDSRPVYIAEAPGETDYSRFLCDILIIDNYYYTINNYTDLGTLTWWNELILGARSDLRNAGREDTEIHALLVLGEEIFPDSLNESVMATHGLTHSAIRRVLELGVNGVWFYAWRAGVIDGEDAVHRWLEQQYYAEPVETEIHDIDYLISAFNNDNGSEIFISNIAYDQAPNEGSNFLFENKTAALTSGDLQGSNHLKGNPVFYDLSYKTNNGFRSNGDGDDELISAFADGNIYFSESGDQPDETLINSFTGNISAITSGDFDGDGDSEIVTAVQIDNQSFIYLSDDGAVESITQYQLFTSDEFIVNALTAGDFNEDGKDELVTALSNSSLTDSYIYIDDISSTGTAATGTPWFGPDNDYHVTSLSAGDFTDDNNYNDMLVFALSTPNLQQTKLYSTRVNNFSFDSSIVFYGPDDNWHVKAITFGDFTDDNNFIKDLIIALSNSSYDHTMMYKTNNPIDNGIGNIIYDSGFPSDYVVSAMTTASFRESHHPVTSIGEDDDLENGNTILKDFVLHQNYPNPFNPSTTIRFTISDLRFTTLKVYDILGKEIVTLVNEEKPAGKYNVEFRIDNVELSSGIYFYQLRVGDYVETKKMILLK